jgi:hypothetical protein
MNVSSVAHHRRSSLSGEKGAVITSRVLRVSTASLTWVWWRLVQILAETPRLTMHSIRQLMLKYGRIILNNFGRKIYCVLFL